MGLLKLGAMQIGIPFLPISPAYSLMSENFAKLKHVIAELQPSLIYVPSLAMFGRALKALDLTGIQVVADAPHPDFPEAMTFDDLLAPKSGPEVAKRRDAVTPDTIAKILLTSGSTGMPKGVINTQRMMCANGTAVDQVWIFLTRRPPVLVDWLPWNHTFGTNFNFNQVLRHGGTMYIDAGKPAPGKLDITLKNLREIQQTRALQRAARLRHAAAGAGSRRRLRPPRVREARRHLLCRRGVAAASVGSGSRRWRSSIAASGCRSSRRSARPRPRRSRASATGRRPISAASGCRCRAATIKLVPDGGKLEMRVRGANVTPGYYRRPDLTEQAFDDEGFFKLGDAVAFIDPDAAGDAGCASTDGCPRISS